MDRKNVGDVMLSRNVARSIKQNDRRYTFPFEKTATYTRQADLAFCNLECPVSARGTVLNKKYTFRAEPKAISGLIYNKFDIVSLANNHTLDYGADALTDTLAHLGEKRIIPVGVCTNDAPQMPAVIEVKGIKIGFLAYADPVTRYSYAKEFLGFSRKPAKGTMEVIRGDIARLRRRVDVVVVSMHWGIEYQGEPDSWQRTMEQKSPRIIFQKSR